MSEKKENIKTDFSWFSNSKIYQIFIDRFSGTKEKYDEEELKKGFLYGNLKSAINKLDYIKSLNFNVIWITPFFVNQKNGYHGYHTINFNHVDPRFAFGENIEDDDIGNPLDENDLNLITKSDQVLIDFIHECHNRNIKVMMDIVFNHVYETHPFFLHAKNNINSIYRKWFYFIEDMTEDEKNSLFPMYDILEERRLKKEKEEKEKKLKEMKEEKKEEIKEEKKEEMKEEKKEEMKEEQKEEMKEEIKKEGEEEIKEEIKKENKEENKEEIKEDNKEEIKKEKKDDNKDENKEEKEHLKTKRKYPLAHLSFLNLGFLPKLNLDTEPCGTYMINVLKKYIKMGIDAIRVDHALGASLNYLKRMTDEIHKEYPNIPFIGEVPPCTLIKFAETIKSISKEKLLLVEKEDLNSIPYVDQIFLDFEGYLNGLLDFNFKNIVKAFCEGEIDYDICIKMLNEHYDKFKGKNIFLVKFLDSHDENRLLFTCNNDKKLMMKALTILFTKFEGRNDPLIIYYGTEDFMSQSKTIYNEDYGDFRTRQPMNFIFEKMKDLFNN